MRVFGLHPATLAATCLLILGGCGGVTFEQPLSDEKTTEVDERLVGLWELDPARSGEEAPGEDEFQDRVAVGRRPDGTLGMEGVVLAIQDGVVQVERFELRPTRIGGHRYLSLPVFDEAELKSDAKAKAKAWWALRYDIEPDGALRIWTLEEKAFAAAVDAGELEGQVDRGDGEEDDPIVVGIAAGTAEVRAWMDAHADTCVKPKSAVFRRLVKKGSTGSRGALDPGDPPAPVPPPPPIDPDDPDDPDDP